MVTVSNLLLPLFGTIWQKMKKGAGYFFLTPSALKLCKFCKSDPIVFLLTTESFYYIFLRRNTEKAEISGFMGGGITRFT